jgi:hypothetical protein
LKIELLLAVVVLFSKGGVSLSDKKIYSFIKLTQNYPSSKGYRLIIKSMNDKGEDEKNLFHIMAISQSVEGLDIYVEPVEIVI